MSDAYQDAIDARNGRALDAMRAKGVRLAEFDEAGSLRHVEFFPYTTVTEAPAGSDVEAEPVVADPLFASA